MFRLLPFAIAIVLSAATSYVSAAAITWDNGNTNMLWSDSVNWNPDGPAAGNAVTFNGTAAAGTQGTTTNIVDSSLAISSLAYVNWNGTGTVPAGPPPASFHTTVINSGLTLTVNGAFTVGTSDLSGTTTTFRGSSTGTGTLTVNNTGTNILVNPGGSGFTPSHTVTLDMSGLGNFNANVNAIRVGAADSGITTMSLAASNDITANEVTVGLNGWNGGGTMRLGQTNTIKTDLLRISATSPQSGNGTINFNTGLSSPTVVFRAKDGVSRIANVQIGYVSNTSGPSPGLLDLTAGSVDALFGAVTLGIADGSALGQLRSGSGTIQFNAGTIDATSITMSTAGPWNGLTAGPQVTSGVLTIGGTGTLLADTINMTVRNSGTASNTSATINLNGTGTLKATNIQRGAALGTGTSSVAFNFNGGTLTHKAGTDLTVGPFVPISILTGTAHNIQADSGRTVSIFSNIGGAGTGVLNKTGAGKLLMLGTNNYVAPTMVLNGTLGGTGSANSNFTVAAGATLAPGASAGTLYTNALTMQANSNLEIEIGGLTPGTQYDQVISSGAVNLSGNLIVKLVNGFSPSNADSFTILQGLSVTGEFSSVTLVGAGLGVFDVVYLSNAVLLTNFHVPEPSTLSLLGLASLGLVGLHRRKRKRLANKPANA